MDDINFNGLRRGVPGQSGATSDEYFLSQKELLANPRLKRKPGSLFLGVSGGQIYKDRDSGFHWVRGGRLIWNDDDQHVMTIAGSRAGKGRGAILPNLYVYPGSVLAIDPKGDLARLTADIRSAQGQDVHVLDPFEVTGPEALKFRSSFNPMKMLDPMSKSIVPDAGVIADALVTSSGEQDSHWDDSARNFIEGLILHVATDSQYKDERDLVTVYKLLMMAEADGFSLEDEMRDSVQADGAIRDVASDFYDRPDNERGSVLSTARRHMRFLSYPNIQDVLVSRPGDRTLESLKQLKTRKTTIYLSLPAMRMGTCFRWFRLFVNLTLVAMEEEKAKPDQMVLMVLDEFAVLGHMKSIEDAAGQIAGLGVKLWPIIQDMGQLKALYKDRWETFLGNAGMLQFFGNSDLTTLEWISKRLGETTVYTKSRNLRSPSQSITRGDRGESVASHLEPLMKIEEIARIFSRNDPFVRQLVFLPGERPMILQRAYYDCHESFTQIGL